jgi:hypothetical protein
LILEPADGALDLKKAALAVGVKRVEMARHAQAEQLTGLKVGGISALALTHKPWPVFIDRRAEGLETIVVSAGQRGRNLRVRVVDFIAVTGANWIDAARSERLGPPPLTPCMRVLFTTGPAGEWEPESGRAKPALLNVPPAELCLSASLSGRQGWGKGIQCEFQAGGRHP